MKKIKVKSLNEIKKILSKTKEFSEIEKWNFEYISMGEMKHKYKISNNKKTYFLKEVKNHEAQMEYFLTKIRLEHLPYSFFPSLLKENILIRPFINGKVLKTKNIDVGLIKDFAIMRNKLNNKKFFDKYNIFKINNFSQKDDGFYKEEFLRNIKRAKAVLKKVSVHKLKEVEDFKEILKYIDEKKDIILSEYLNMPFEKQHQDFREENIIVDGDNKHKLIDWGSSYGYNPFMYDISIFLVDNDDLFNEYIKTSNVCLRLNNDLLKRWLYCALVARFLDFLVSRIGGNSQINKLKEKCQKILRYEYKCYKKIKEYKF